MHTEALVMPTLHFSHNHHCGPTSREGDSYQRDNPVCGGGGASEDVCGCRGAFEREKGWGGGGLKREWWEQTHHQSIPVLQRNVDTHLANTGMQGGATYRSPAVSMRVIHWEGLKTLARTDAYRGTSLRRKRHPLRTTKAP